MKVIVIGMNPAARCPSKRIVKNSTFDRLNKWMSAARVKHYSFLNCFDEVCAVPKPSMIDSERFQFIDDAYTVLALGGFASAALNRLNIAHHRLPHPSPRNRLFNDVDYEKLVIKQLKAYLK